MDGIADGASSGLIIVCNRDADPADAQALEAAGVEIMAIEGPDDLSVLQALAGAAFPR